MKLSDKVSVLEARLAAVKAAQGAVATAVAALGHAAAPDDEALAEGDAVVHLADHEVFAMSGGKMLHLRLRGIIPVPPPAAAVVVPDPA